MEMMCGASLAQYGLLGSVKRLCLNNVDLSPVPAQHLASLVSCVTSDLVINNVSGCDLVSILTSLKCRQLYITNQSLGREETQALVQAMESGVETVKLGGLVTLDVEALAEYRGQGVCWKVKLCGDTVDRYKEDLSKWARSIDWRVESGGPLQNLSLKRMRSEDDGHDDMTDLSHDGVTEVSVCEPHISHA